MNVNIPIDEVYNKIMNSKFRNEDGSSIMLSKMLKTSNLTENAKKDYIRFKMFCEYFFALSAEGKTENEIAKWIVSTCDTIYKMHQEKYEKF